MKTVLEEAALEAFGAGIRGQFRASDDWMARLAGAPSVEAEAWAAALGAQRWLSDPTVGRLPERARIASLAASDPSVARAVSLACAAAERASMLRFDRPELEAWIAVHRAVSDPNDPWLKLALAWHGILAGARSEVAAEDELPGVTEQESVALALETVSLRAMAALIEGDMDEATKLARRASRMARTESAPQCEYLANVILARIRRRAGAPHLASRILGGLLRVASSPWRAWLAWELLLASGLEAEDVLASAQPAQDQTTASPIGALLRAARDGDRAGYDAALARASEVVAGFAPLAQELEALDRCLRSTGQVPGTVEDWSLGRTNVIPFGLDGIYSGDASAPVHTATILAHVLAAQGAVPRRILSAGTGLATADTGARLLPPASAPQLRTESTIAAVALAGPAGLPEDDLFRAVYGFPYQAAVHSTARKVLYHRVRQRLEGVGSLVRNEGRITLTLEGAWLVPDPRCVRPSDYNVVSALARWGHASPREAAERLGIPLRTVQEILKRLADEGVCVVEREGRALRYVLEDTTFSEPTRA